MQKIGDLEINQDLNFERRSWMVERIAWAVGLLTLLAALLGFLGPGPLGKAIAASPDKSISLNYYRMERYQAPAEWRLQIDGKLAKQGELRLWVHRRFVEAIATLQIDPEPESVEIQDERFVYSFKAVKPPPVIKVFFRFEPNKIGKTPAQFGVVDGPAVEFSQFYLP
jgi:hypothetical protein